MEINRELVKRVQHRISIAIKRLYDIAELGECIMTTEELKNMATHLSRLLKDCRQLLPDCKEPELLRFVCPDCGNSRIEEIGEGWYVYPVEDIVSTDEITYSEEGATITEIERVRYQCERCGWSLPSYVSDAESLYEYLDKEGFLAHPPDADAEG